MDSQIFKTPYGTQELQNLADSKLRAYNKAHGDLEECTMQNESRLKMLEEFQLQHFEKENELFMLKRSLEESEKKEAEMNDQVNLLKNKLTEMRNEKEKFEDDICRQNNSDFHTDVILIFENVEKYRELFDTAKINAEYESLNKKNASLIQELDDAKHCFENLKKTQILDTDLETRKSLKNLKEAEKMLNKEVVELKQQKAKLELMARNMESQKLLYSM